MPYDLFKEYVGKAAGKFRELDRRKTVRIISHLDADGIAAAALLVKTMTLLRFRYSMTIVNNLDIATLNMLSKEDHSYFIFADLGSGQLKAITQQFKEKTVFILDHHIPQNAKLEGNVLHVNPFLFGIDASKEVSGAGVTYFFCKALDDNLKSFAHVAVIGAIGDQQDKEGFLNLNKEIAEDAIASKKMKVIQGVRFFGRQTRPIHKLLEYSTDPYIPGVTGSAKGSMTFLESLGIPYQKAGAGRKIINLTEDEMKLLIKGIIKKRKHEKNPKDIFGSMYILLDEEKGSPLRDAKEFSTLLNACGRLGKSSLGVGVCLGDKKSKDKALEMVAEYKREILEMVRWFEKNRKSEHVIEGENFIIINGEANMKPTLIGTLVSMLSYSSEMKDTEYIFGMAQNVDGTTKISLRFAGNECDCIDLRNIMKLVIKRLGAGESGGHRNAAGGVIPSEKEDEFIEAVKKVFSDNDFEECEC